MPGADSPIQPVHISIELEIDGLEVRGHAAAAPEPPREFHGWLGLIATIDELSGADRWR